MSADRGKRRIVLKIRAGHNPGAEDQRRLANCALHRPAFAVPLLDAALDVVKDLRRRRLFFSLCLRLQRETKNKANDTYTKYDT